MTSENWHTAIAVLVAAAFCALAGADAQESSGSSGAPAPNSSLRLFIDPSSSFVTLGTAKLIVSPLAQRGSTYAGDYQLKVVPYFFKSQKGPLLLAPPPDLYRHLVEGMTVEFTGVATNDEDGKTKAVTGKIAPPVDGRGHVIFSVETDNGKMMFDTSYHFAP